MNKINAWRHLLEMYTSYRWGVIILTMALIINVHNIFADQAPSFMYWLGFLAGLTGTSMMIYNLWTTRKEGP